MSFVYLLSQRISLFNSGKLELWIISFFSSLYTFEEYTWKKPALVYEMKGLAI